MARIWAPKRVHQVTDLFIAEAPGTVEQKTSNSMVHDLGSKYMCTTRPNHKPPEGFNWVKSHTATKGSVVYYAEKP